MGEHLGERCGGQRNISPENEMIGYMKQNVIPVLEGESFSLRILGK
jgi:hypothetical protein